MSTIHEYPNGDIAVIWKPDVCIHSGVCVKMLPKVYHPKGKPWILPMNATTEQLKTQIDRCPSGALSFRSLSEEERVKFFERHSSRES